MHPVKMVYNFILTIQIFSLIVFIFFLIENNFDVSVPIGFKFTIPVPLLDDIIVDFSYDLQFNYSTILLLVITAFFIFVLISITAVGSGLNDSGNMSIKQLISFLAKFFLMQVPLIFLMSQSNVLKDYVTIVNLIALTVYVINLFIDIGDEKFG